MALIEAEGAKVLSQIAGPLIAGAVVLAAGFGAGVAYEHKAPWALGPQLTRLKDSIPALQAKAIQAGVDAQTAADKTAFTNWGNRLNACTAARQQDAVTAGQQISAARAARDASSSAAYRLGRSTCGATHAAASPGAPGASPDPGGVRDGATDFRSFFAPSAPAPAGVGAVPPGGAVPPSP